MKETVFGASIVQPQDSSRCRSGQKGFAGDGGDAKASKLNGPKGAAVNPGVALYIADTENHAIRMVDLKSGLISTVAGSPEGKGGFNGDGTEPTTRLLKRPHGVCWLQVANC